MERKSSEFLKHALIVSFALTIALAHAPKSILAEETIKKSPCQETAENAGFDIFNHSIPNLEPIDGTDYSARKFHQPGINGDFHCFEIYENSALIGSATIGTGEFSDATNFEFSASDSPVGKLQLQIRRTALAGVSEIAGTQQLSTENIAAFRSILSTLNQSNIFFTMDLVPVETLQTPL